MAPYDPMKDILDNIDKQMEEKGIIAKDIPKEPENQNPKIPRVENSDLVSKSPKKKLNDLDKYLIFAFSNLIIYTIVALFLFYKTGSEPAVLTGCFFAAFGGEILMCALIKRLKLHKEAKEVHDGSDNWLSQNR